MPGHVQRLGRKYHIVKAKKDRPDEGSGWATRPSAGTFLLVVGAQATDGIAVTGDTAEPMISVKACHTTPAPLAGVGNVMIRGCCCFVSSGHDFGERYNGPGDIYFPLVRVPCDLVTVDGTTRLGLVKPRNKRRPLLSGSRKGIPLPCLP